MRRDVVIEFVLRQIFRIERGAGRFFLRADEWLVILQSIPRTFALEEVVVRRTVLLRQLRAPLRILFGDLAPENLVDLFRRFDQFRYDLTRAVVAERADA